MPRKKTVDEKIDELTRAVKRGFDETASKTEIRVLTERIDRAEERMERGFQAIIETLDLIKQELVEVKRSHSLMISAISSEIA